MSYEAYPLFGFQSGLRTDRESWLTPEDAFEQLENISLFRGQLLKRPPARLLTTIGTKVIGEALGTNHVGQLCGNTSGGSIPSAPAIANLAKLVNLPLQPPTVVTLDKPITLVLAPYQFRVVGPALATDIYALEWFAGTALTQPYTAKINMATGAWYVQLTAADAFTAVASTATYEFLRGLPAMLITEWINAGGNRELVITDTRRLFVFNTARGRFDDKSAATATLATDDVWNGGVTDFFSAATVDDGSQRRLVIVNGLSKPKKWTGTALTDMGVSDGVSDQLSAATMVFAQYGHVIYLAPTVGGAPNRQRAMWSEQFLTETVFAKNYAVVFSGEKFITAAMVQDEILCFFDRSVYKLRYTQDFRAPFEWVHISGGVFDRADTQGGVSRTGIVALDDRAVALGPHGIVEANGAGASDATAQIPNLMRQFLDPTKLSISYGVAFDEQHELWFSVVTTQAQTNEPDKVLVLSRDTGAVSFHTWGFRIFGLFRKQDSVPAWKDVPWKDTPMKDVTAVPAAAQNLAGFPTVLAGDLLGNIYELAGGGVIADGLGSSRVFFRTKLLNPFTTDGEWKEAHLGWWLLYLTPQPGQTLTVRLYADDSQAPYATYILPLDPVASAAKIMKRIRVNRAARWHRLEGEYNSDAPFAGDALTGWFAPGRLVVGP